MHPPARKAEHGYMRALIIVRRGASERFQIVQEMFAGEAVEPIWDRRRGERRERRDPITAERRRSDRRGPPPVTWTALDFVVVHLAHRQGHAPGGPAWR